jgi:hypothetical protein
LSARHSSNSAVGKRQISIVQKLEGLNGLVLLEQQKHKHNLNTIAMEF